MEELLNKAKAALDANADGEIDFEEVVDAAVDRVVETKDAVVDVAQSVKEAFDEDADGEVSAAEIGAVAAGAIDISEGTFDNFGNKLESIRDKIGDALGSLFGSK